MSDESAKPTETTDGNLTDTNQHYVTKAHLDKFIHPAAGQAILYPYRKGGSPCKPRGTKRLGSAINFYRQRENGILTDKLDDARKTSELMLFSSGKRTPSALSKCIYDDTFVPTTSERLQLSAAAAFLFCSSPVQIHNAAMLSMACTQMEFLNLHNTEEGEAAFREAHGEGWKEKLKESRKDALSGKLFVDVGDENRKQLGFFSFQIEREIIQLLQSMHMTIVDCHYKCIFLTSDNPVVRTFPSAHGKHDDEVWFPISYNRAILWHRRRPETRSGLGYSGSYAYNRRMIKHSYKFIFSPLQQPWITQACSEETHNPLLGHYGSLQEIMQHAKPAFSSNGEALGEAVDVVAVLKSGKKLDILGI